MPAAYTISQITAYIKSRFAEDDLLADVWLAGEVSNFKQHTSGHCYFTLKDGGAAIRAVIWRTAAQRMALPREGDAVTAHGQISVYEPQGVYQFYVDRLEPAGAGRLWMEFERLRNQLDAEGLFDAARKRPIPARPRRLGVVTSATGAALRDILRTLAARYPLVEVLLAPATVQGDAAPPTIVAALALLNRYATETAPLDVIIVARGGGASEELWAFNDERVARAIAASATPVISGVGHETDFTIADFVADARAATPTAAAMLATPDARQLAADVDALADRAAAQAQRQTDAARTALAHLVRRNARATPIQRIANHRQRVDDLTRRATRALANSLATRRGDVTALERQAASLDVARVLGRGYAIVTAAGGAVVFSITQVAAGDALRVRVSDGAFLATAGEQP